MRKIKGSLAAAAVAAVIVGGASAASAATVFLDNFNADPTGLNKTPAGWKLDSGSVDIIGVGTQFSLLPSVYGHYIDLDGTSGVPGSISTKTYFGPGTYTLSFDLAGSYRNDIPKTTVVTLGNWSQSYTLTHTAVPTLYTATFLTSGGYLNFADLAGGNNDIGNLLDNVSVTAIPEASTWAMLLAGFAGLGFAAFRKSNKAPVGIA